MGDPGGFSARVGDDPLDRLQSQQDPHHRALHPAHPDSAGEAGAGDTSSALYPRGFRQGRQNLEQ